MSLIRDMLGVSPTTLKAAAQLNENTKKESKSKKQYGRNREVYALCDTGLPPQAVGAHGSFKKKQALKPFVSPWKMVSFSNPARTDKLHLQHWCKEADATQEYPFAKYNFTIKIPKYNDFLYNKELMKMDASWTKEETDYLWELCERFDLRFHVIHDRYDTSFNRSVEQLKHRYYSVARRIIEYQFEDRIRQEIDKHGAAAAQKIVATIKDEKNRQPLVKFTYSIEKDQERKNALEKQYRVTDAMKKREAELVEEIKSHEAHLKRNEKKKEDMKKTKKKFDLPEDAIIPISLLQPLTKPCTTVASTQLERFRANIPSRFNDQIDAYLSCLSVKAPLVYSRNVVESYCALQLDVAIMLNLQKKVERMRKENEYWQVQLDEQKRQMNALQNQLSTPSHPLYLQQQAALSSTLRHNSSPALSATVKTQFSAKRMSQKSSQSATDSESHSTMTSSPNLPNFSNSKGMMYLPPFAVRDGEEKSSVKKQRKSKASESQPNVLKMV